MKNKTLRCFKCNKELEEVFSHQPANGVSFASAGNYGSKVFDPMVSGLFIQINICDSCLNTYREDVVMCMDISKREIEYKEFDPDQI